MSLVMNMNDKTATALYVTQMFGNGRKEEEPPELVFNAVLVSDDPDNEKRTFIIRFSTVDDEVKIWENESDGFRGGFFYKSPHYREKGKFDSLRCWIGNSVDVNGVLFKLTDAPDSTFNLMETDPDLYPKSDLYSIITRISKLNVKEELRTKFEALDKDKLIRINMDDAEQILTKNEKLLLSQHEIKTILRRFKFYNTNKFSYDEFLLSI